MPVAFDTAGMERHDERTWFDPRTGDQVSLTYIGMVPDIPAPLDDLPTLRRKLAEETAETGAIIEAHVVRLGGVPALFQLIKLPIPGQDTGLAFIAAFTLPRATCSAVLRIQCTEGPMSGVRESTVAAQVGFENCFPPHPYAPELRGQLPYNVADEASWDQQFQDHPLSRARVWAHRTMATAHVDPQFAALPAFELGARVQDHWSPPEPVAVPAPPPEPEPWSAPSPSPEPAAWSAPEQQTPWSTPESEVQPAFRQESVPDAMQQPGRHGSDPDPRWQHPAGSEADSVPQPAPSYEPEPDMRPRHTFGAEPNAPHQPAPEQHSYGAQPDPMAFGSEADPMRHPVPSFAPEPPQAFIPEPDPRQQHPFGSDPNAPRQPAPEQHSYGAQPDPMAFGSEADPMRHSVPSFAPEPPQVFTDPKPVPSPAHEPGHHSFGAQSDPVRQPAQGFAPEQHQSSLFAPEQAFDAPPAVRPNLFAPEPEPAPAPTPAPEPPPVEAGDVLNTVLVGLPVGAYLPLWQEDGVTFWRMLDPDAVRTRLGAGAESRSEIDKRRYREAAMFSPSRGTLFMMDRYRDESGHLGGTSTQLAPATEAEAYAAVDDKALSGLYAWLGEVVLSAVGRSEFVAIECGGWKVPMTPVVLVMLRTDGREWHSVVETSPVPVGAPVWRDQQPVDGDTQVLASPATDQTVRASGLLTRFAVATWGKHPFELGLSFGPNPTLQQQ